MYFWIVFNLVVYTYQCLQQLNYCLILDFLKVDFPLVESFFSHCWLLYLECNLRFAWLMYFILSLTHKLKISSIFVACENFSKLQFYSETSEIYCYFDDILFIAVLLQFLNDFSMAGRLSKSSIEIDLLHLPLRVSEVSLSLVSGHPVKFLGLSLPSPPQQRGIVQTIFRNLRCFPAYKKSENKSIIMGFRGLKCCKYNRFPCYVQTTKLD